MPNPTAMDDIFSYDPSALRRDGMRAGLGIALCFGLLLLAPVWGIAFMLLLLTLAVFAAFALATGIKAFTRLALEGAVLRRTLVGPAVLLAPLMNREIPLDQLERVRVRFYGTRRGGDGVLEMNLRGRGRNLTIDGALDGFRAVLGAAVAGAARSGLRLDDTTLANLDELGINHAQVK